MLAMYSLTKTAMRSLGRGVVYVTSPRFFKFSLDFIDVSKQIIHILISNAKRQIIKICFALCCLVREGMRPRSEPICYTGILKLLAKLIGLGNVVRKLKIIHRILDSFTELVIKAFFSTVRANQRLSAIRRSDCALITDVLFTAILTMSAVSA